MSLLNAQSYISPSFWVVGSKDAPDDLAAIRFIAETAKCEEARTSAFHLAMRETRVQEQHNAIGTRPTAAKLRTLEEPVLSYVVDYARLSTAHRCTAVQALLDNLETRSGHLSVNRAKQALKLIAKNVGIQVLGSELNDPNPKVRLQAAHLLGWCKSTAALKPLLLKFSQCDHREKVILGQVLMQHYDQQVLWFVRAKLPSLENLLGELFAGS